MKNIVINILKAVAIAAAIFIWIGLDSITTMLIG